MWPLGITPDIRRRPIPKALTKLSRALTKGRGRQLASGRTCTDAVEEGEDGGIRCDLDQSGPLEIVQALGEKLRILTLHQKLRRSKNLSC